MMMASKHAIAKALKSALHDIGKVNPWFDEEANAWIFSHPLYPVEYAGSCCAEVVKKYPLYLKEFIAQRLDENLDPLIEQETKGRAGCAIK
jgi:hypothetical protein